MSRQSCANADPPSGWPAYSQHKADQLLLGAAVHAGTCGDSYWPLESADPGEPTIARTLGQAGYVTGCFGKWHLGDNYLSRPMDLGFDESLVHLVRSGLPEKSSDYCSDVFTDECINFIDRQSTG